MFHRNLQETFIPLSINMHQHVLFDFIICKNELFSAFKVSTGTFESNKENKLYTLALL